jgi:hypothetical protein
MNIERLRQLVELVGKQRLVLDLSCRKKVTKYKKHLLFKSVQSWFFLVAL